MKLTTLLALSLFNLPAAATTLTWSGKGGDKLWSNKDNWAEEAVPSDGDSLIFPSGASQKATENDLDPGLAVESLAILAADYTLGGNAIGIASGITLNFPGLGAVLVELPVTVRAAQTWSLAAGNVVNFSATMVLNDSLTVHPVSSGFVRLDGIVSGSGALTKTGSGTLFLNGDNTFTGTCDMQEGTVTLGHANALGSSVAGTVLGANTLLRVGGNAVIAEPLTLNTGAIVENQAGEPTLSGGVILNGGGTFRAFTGRLIFSGVVSGSGALTSIGQTRLTGTAANTWTGGTSVVAGTMQLGKTPGVNAVPGNVSMNVNGRLELLASHQIPDPAVVSLTATGRLIVPAAVEETIGGLAMQAGVVDNAGALTVDGNVTIAADATASSIGGSVRVANSSAPASGRTWTVESGAVITAAGALSGDLLRKTGPGELRCPGDGSTLSLRLESGSLLWQGNSPASALIMQGGTLRGTGLTGAVTMSPSAGSARLEPGSGPGIFRTGDIAANLSLTLALELNGTVRGTDYDSLEVTGSTNFGLPRLVLSVGYPAAIGDTFTILNKTSAGPVSGQFLGGTVALGEGSFIAAPGSHYFRISYTGGDGNDVVLTKVAPPSAEVTAFTAVPAPGQPGFMRVNLSATAGRGLNHRIEGSSDLINWSLLTTFPADATGRITTEFTHPAQSRFYYRLALP